jgi:hypothetical protein
MLRQWYFKAVVLVKREDSPDYNKVKLSLGLIPSGLFIAVLGCFMTIKESMAKQKMIIN